MLSDRICTALQLAEHCQDVAEDLRRGRIYIPAEDLARFGCGPQELSAAHASPALRAVLAFEVERARGLIAEGLPLLGMLRGRARLAVAAFAAGGSAALDAIERAGYDVLAGPPAAGYGPGCWRSSRPCAVPRHDGGERRDRVRAGLRPLRSDHARAGRQLLLRHPAALARAPPGDVRGLRLRAARRRHRRRRSARGAKARGAASPGRGARRARHRGEADDGRSGDGGAGRRPHPLRAATGRARRADRGRAHGRRGRPLRELRGARALLPPRRRRGRAGVPGDLRAARGPPRGAGTRLSSWPTISAWRCSSRTSCATSARTPRTGASTCPPRTCAASVCPSSRTPCSRRFRPPRPARRSPRSSAWSPSRRPARASGSRAA